MEGGCSVSGVTDPITGLHLADVITPSHPHTRLGGGAPTAWTQLVTAERRTPLAANLKTSLAPVQSGHSDWLLRPCFLIGIYCILSIPYCLLPPYFLPLLPPINSLCPPRPVVLTLPNVCDTSCCGDSI